MIQNKDLYAHLHGYENINNEINDVFFLRSKEESMGVAPENLKMLKMSNWTKFCFPYNLKLPLKSSKNRLLEFNKCLLLSHDLTVTCTLCLTLVYSLNSCSHLQPASQRMYRAVKYGKVQSVKNWNDVNFTH